MTHTLHDLPCWRRGPFTRTTCRRRGNEEDPCTGRYPATRCVARMVVRRCAVRCVASAGRRRGCRSGGRACHRAWLTPGLIWEVADGRRLQARGVNCALL